MTFKFKFRCSYAKTPMIDPFPKTVNLQDFSLIPLGVYKFAQ